MPNPIDLATLLAQTPHVAKVKTAATSRSETAQTELAQEAQAKRQKERAKVEQTGDVVRVDKDGRNKDQSAQEEREREPEEQPEEAAEPTECTSDAAGVCGKIINKRI